MPGGTQLVGEADDAPCQPGRVLKQDDLGHQGLRPFTRIWARAGYRPRRALSGGQPELPASAEAAADLADREVERCFERAGIALGLGQQQPALEGGEGSQREPVDVGGQRRRRTRRGTDVRYQTAEDVTCYLREQEITLTYNPAAGTLQAGTGEATQTITLQAS
jgi:hypothetical protein